MSDKLSIIRAGTGAVKCRLLCLRAPSNRATIPAHKSWLGLEFCYQEEPLVIERERTDYIEPMLILSIFYFSYLGRSPTLLFAIKKHFCWLTRFLSDGVVAMGHPLAWWWWCRQWCAGRPAAVLMAPSWISECGNFPLGRHLNFLNVSPISLKWDKLGRFERLILTIELVTMWKFFS